jgi:5'(3')-deoxyribonucleotidase
LRDIHSPAASPESGARERLAAARFRVRQSKLGGLDAVSAKAIELRVHDDVSVRDRGPLRGLILGVDLDGVCADFYGKMREVAAEWFERPIEELTKDVTYGLGEWGVGAQYHSLHRFAVTERRLFETAAMIPGARKHLRQLSDEGARIRIITNRLTIRYFHNLAVTQTTGWLDHHGIPYWDLCFMKSKEQVGADIYIDDTPDNIASLRARNFYAICFANSTNKDISDPRAESWDEVYTLVHTRARELGFPK